MTDESRTGITDSIAFAHAQLKAAREDGGCERINFWRARIDQLLEELSAQPRENAQ